MTKELLHFRIFLLGLFVFLIVVFHINVRIQVVSLGYELSEMRSDLDKLKKKEWETQLQKERLMSAKSLLKFLKLPRYSKFQLAKPEQIVFIRK
ncbi:MAG: hypothetical protein R3A80_05785 [Bdellovibrionota bacterium]